MKAPALFCLAGIVALTGCASNYPMTYNSVPQGAVVVCGTRVLGTTPVTLYGDPAKLSEIARKYAEFLSTLPPEEKERSRKFALCSAQWASGATAPYLNTMLDPKDYPNGMNHLAIYPGDANSRAIDEARAMQTQQMQSQQQQVQMQQPVQQPIPVYQPQPLPAMPTTSFPSAPGRATTVCRTLSNGTVVCD